MRMGGQLYCSVPIPIGVHVFIAVQQTNVLWLSPRNNNTLDSTGNYSDTSNNTKLVHWPLMGGLLHLVQREGAWAGCGPAQSPPHCTKCNSPPINGQCTNHCIVIWRFVALLFAARCFASAAYALMRCVFVCVSVTCVCLSVHSVKTN